jgi:hypothetical protein
MKKTRQRNMLTHMLRLPDAKQEVCKPMLTSNPPPPHTKQVVINLSPEGVKLVSTPSGRDRRCDVNIPP